MNCHIYLELEDDKIKISKNKNQFGSIYIGKFDLDKEEDIYNMIKKINTIRYVCSNIIYSQLIEAGINKKTLLNVIEYSIVEHKMEITKLKKIYLKLEGNIF